LPISKATDLFFSDLSDNSSILVINVSNKYYTRLNFIATSVVQFELLTIKGHKQFARGGVRIVVEEVVEFFVVVDGDVLVEATGFLEEDFADAADGVLVLVVDGEGETQ
jgi:hypothetical protein